MSTASRGAAREHKVKRLLEEHGFAVTRGAGSHGCADLWAAKARTRYYPECSHGDVELKLVQVKGNAGSPWKNFGRKEREALIALADETGGEAWLVHWPPNGASFWIAEQDWPKVKVAA